MTALLERNDTVIPTEDDARLAAESSRILSRARDEEQLHVQLENGETVLLPRSVTRLLSHLLLELANGHAVTVFPVHAELTTQEAADLLNVSRPYLIGLLTAGVLPHHKTGTHRRVKFTDLMAYKRRIEKESEEAKRELAREAQELGLGY